MLLSILTALILTSVFFTVFTAEFKKHVQNCVYPFDVETPTYNIESWVKQLHLQQCAFVEVGDKHYAIFVETRPRRYDNEKEIHEYFLGLCDDDTVAKWSLCSPNLFKKRSKDCTFHHSNMYGTRVHRRLCDISRISQEGTQCDCSSDLSDSKLFKVTGFPTCFRAPLPDSLCGENNVCGLASCKPEVINKKIYSAKCDTKCLHQQPFCERPDRSSSQPRILKSFWTDWSNPYCTDISCVSQFDEATCINRETGRGDIDCLGPGTSCCTPDIQNCRCHVYEEDGIAKVFRTFSIPQPELVEYMSEEDFINSIPLRYLNNEEFHKYPEHRSAAPRSPRYTINNPRFGKEDDGDIFAYSTLNMKEINPVSELFRLSSFSQDLPQYERTISDNSGHTEEENPIARPLRSTSLGAALKQTIYEIYDRRPIKFGNRHRLHRHPLNNIKNIILHNFKPSNVPPVKKKRVVAEKNRPKRKIALESHNDNTVDTENDQHNQNNIFVRTATGKDVGRMLKNIKNIESGHDLEIHYQNTIDNQDINHERLIRRVNHLKKINYKYQIKLQNNMDSILNGKKKHNIAPIETLHDKQNWFTKTSIRKNQEHHFDIRPPTLNEPTIVSNNQEKRQNHAKPYIQDQGLTIYKRALSARSDVEKSNAIQMQLNTSDGSQEDNIAHDANKSASNEALNKINSENVHDKDLSSENKDELTMVQTESSGDNTRLTLIIQKEKDNKINVQKRNNVFDGKRLSNSFRYNTSNKKEINEANSYSGEVDEAPKGVKTENSVANDEANLLKNLSNKKLDTLLEDPQLQDVFPLSAGDLIGESEVLKNNLISSKQEERDHMRQPSNGNIFEKESRITENLITLNNLIKSVNPTEVNFNLKVESERRYLASPQKVESDGFIENLLEIDNFENINYKIGDRLTLANENHLMKSDEHFIKPADEKKRAIEILDFRLPAAETMPETSTRAIHIYDFRATEEKQDISEDESNSKGKNRVRNLFDSIKQEFEKRDANSGMKVLNIHLARETPTIDKSAVNKRETFADNTDRKRSSGRLKRKFSDKQKKMIYKRHLSSKKKIKYQDNLKNTQGVNFKDSDHCGNEYQVRCDKVKIKNIKRNDVSGNVQKINTENLILNTAKMNKIAMDPNNDFISIRGGLNSETDNVLNYEPRKVNARDLHIKSMNSRLKEGSNRSRRELKKNLLKSRFIIDKYSGDALEKAMLKSKIFRKRNSGSENGGVYDNSEIEKSPSDRFKRRTESYLLRRNVNKEILNIPKRRVRRNILKYLFKNKPKNKFYDDNRFPKSIKHSKDVNEENFQDNVESLKEQFKKLQEIEQRKSKIWNRQIHETSPGQNDYTGGDVDSNDNEQIFQRNLSNLKEALQQLVRMQQEKHIDAKDVQDRKATLNDNLETNIAELRKSIVKLQGIQSHSRSEMKLPDEEKVFLDIEAITEDQPIKRNTAKINKFPIKRVPANDNDIRSERKYFLIHPEGVRDMPNKLLTKTQNFLKTAKDLELQLNKLQEINHDLSKNLQRRHGHDKKQFSHNERVRNLDPPDNRLDQDGSKFPEKQRKVKGNVIKDNLVNKNIENIGNLRIETLERSHKSDASFKNIQDFEGGETVFTRRGFREANANKKRKACSEGNQAKRNRKIFKMNIFKKKRKKKSKCEQCPLLEYRKRHHKRSIDHTEITAFKKNENKLKRNEKEILNNMVDDDGEIRSFNYEKFRHSGEEGIEGKQTDFVITTIQIFDDVNQLDYKEPTSSSIKQANSNDIQENTTSMKNQNVISFENRTSVEGDANTVSSTDTDMLHNMEKGNSSMTINEDNKQQDNVEIKENTVNGKQSKEEEKQKLGEDNDEDTLLKAFEYLPTTADSYMSTTTEIGTKQAYSTTNENVNQSTISKGQIGNVHNNQSNHNDNLNGKADGKSSHRDDVESTEIQSQFSNRNAGGEEGTILLGDHRKRSQNKEQMENQNTDYNKFGDFPDEMTFEAANAEVVNILRDSKRLKGHESTINPTLVPEKDHGINTAANSGSELNRKLEEVTKNPYNLHSMHQEITNNHQGTNNEVNLMNKELASLQRKVAEIKFPKNGVLQNSITKSYRGLSTSEKAFTTKQGRFHSREKGEISEEYDKDIVAEFGNIFQDFSQLRSLEEKASAGPLGCEEAHEKTQIGRITSYAVKKKKAKGKNDLPKQNINTETSKMAKVPDIRTYTLPKEVDLFSLNRNSWEDPYLLKSVPKFHSYGGNTLNYLKSLTINSAADQSLSKSTENNIRMDNIIKRGSDKEIFKRIMKHQPISNRDYANYLSKYRIPENKKDLLRSDDSQMNLMKNSGKNGNEIIEENENKLDASGQENIRPSSTETEEIDTDAKKNDDQNQTINSDTDTTDQVKKSEDFDDSNLIASQGEKGIVQSTENGFTLLTFSENREEMDGKYPTANQNFDATDVNFNNQIEKDKPILETRSEGVRENRRSFKETLGECAIKDLYKQIGANHRDLINKDARDDLKGVAIHQRGILEDNVVIGLDPDYANSQDTSMVDVLLNGLKIRNSELDPKTDLQACKTGSTDGDTSDESPNTPAPSVIPEAGILLSPEVSPAATYIPLGDPISPPSSDSNSNAEHSLANSATPSPQPVNSNEASVPSGSSAGASKGMISDKVNGFVLLAGVAKSNPPESSTDLVNSCKTPNQATDAFLKNSNSDVEPVNAGVDNNNSQSKIGSNNGQMNNNQVLKNTCQDTKTPENVQSNGVGGNIKNEEKIINSQLNQNIASTKSASPGGTNGNNSTNSSETTTCKPENKCPPPKCPYRCQAENECPPPKCPEIPKCPYKCEPDSECPKPKCPELPKCPYLCVPENDCPNPKCPELPKCPYKCEPEVECPAPKCPPKCPDPSRRMPDNICKICKNLENNIKMQKIYEILKQPNKCARNHLSQGVRTQKCSSCKTTPPAKCNSCTKPPPKCSSCHTTTPPTTCTTCELPPTPSCNSCFVSEEPLELKHRCSTCKHGKLKLQQQQREMEKQQKVKPGNHEMKSSLHDAALGRFIDRINSNYKCKIGGGCDDKNLAKYKDNFGVSEKKHEYRDFISMGTNGKSSDRNVGFYPENNTVGVTQCSTNTESTVDDLSGLQHVLNNKLQGNLDSNLNDDGYQAKAISEVIGRIILQEFMRSKASEKISINSENLLNHEAFKDNTASQDLMKENRNNDNLLKQPSDLDSSDASSLLVIDDPDKPKGGLVEGCKCKNNGLSEYPDNNDISPSERKLQKYLERTIGQHEGKLHETMKNKSQADHLVENILSTFLDKSKSVSSKRQNLNTVLNNKSKLIDENNINTLFKHILLGLSNEDQKAKEGTNMNGLSSEEQETNGKALLNNKARKIKAFSKNKMTNLKNMRSDKTNKYANALFYKSAKSKFANRTQRDCKQLTKSEIFLPNVVFENASGSRFKCVASKFASNCGMVEKGQQEGYSSKFAKEMPKINRKLITTGETSVGQGKQATTKLCATRDLGIVHTDGVSYKNTELDEINFPQRQRTNDVVNKLNRKLKRIVNFSDFNINGVRVELFSKFGLSVNKKVTNINMSPRLQDVIALASGNTNGLLSKNLPKPTSLSDESNLGVYKKSPDEFVLSLNQEIPYKKVNQIVAVQDSTDYTPTTEKGINNYVTLKKYEQKMQKGKHEPLKMVYPYEENLGNVENKNKNIYNDLVNHSTVEKLNMLQRYEKLPDELKNPNQENITRILTDVSKGGKVKRLESDDAVSKRKSLTDSSDIGGFETEDLTKKNVIKSYSSIRPDYLYNSEIYNNANSEEINSNFIIKNLVRPLQTYKSKEDSNDFDLKLLKQIPEFNIEKSTTDVGLMPNTLSFSENYYEPIHANAESAKSENHLKTNVINLDAKDDHFKMSDKDLFPREILITPRSQPRYQESNTQGNIFQPTITPSYFIPSIDVQNMHGLNYITEQPDKYKSEEELAAFLQTSNIELENIKRRNKPPGYLANNFMDSATEENALKPKNYFFNSLRTSRNNFLKDRKHGCMNRLQTARIKLNDNENRNKYERRIVKDNRKFVPSIRREETVENTNSDNKAGRFKLNNPVYLKTNRGCNTRSDLINKTPLIKSKLDNQASLNNDLPNKLGLKLSGEGYVKNEATGYTDESKVRMRKIVTLKRADFRTNRDMPKLRINDQLQNIHQSSRIEADIRTNRDMPKLLINDELQNNVLSSAMEADIRTNRDMPKLLMNDPLQNNIYSSGNRADLRENRRTPKIDFMKFLRTRIKLSNRQNGTKTTTKTKDGLTQTQLKLEYYGGHPSSTEGLATEDSTFKKHACSSEQMHLEPKFGYQADPAMAEENMQFDSSAASDPNISMLDLDKNLATPANLFPEEHSTTQNEKDFEVSFPCFQGDKDGAKESEGFGSMGSIPQQNFITVASGINLDNNVAITAEEVSTIRPEKAADVSFPCFQEDSNKENGEYGSTDTTTQMYPSGLNDQMSIASLIRNPQSDFAIFPTSNVVSEAPPAIDFSENKVNFGRMCQSEDYLGAVDMNNKTDHQVEPSAMAPLINSEITSSDGYLSGNSGQGNIKDAQMITPETVRGYDHQQTNIEVMNDENQASLSQTGSDQFNSFRNTGDNQPTNSSENSSFCPEINLETTSSTNKGLGDTNEQQSQFPENQAAEKDESINNGGGKADEQGSSLMTSELSTPSTMLSAGGPEENSNCIESASQSNSFETNSVNNQSEDLKGISEHNHEPSLIFSEADVQKNISENELKEKQIPVTSSGNQTETINHPPSGFATGDSNKNTGQDIKIDYSTYNSKLESETIGFNSANKNPEEHVLNGSTNSNQVSNCSAENEDNSDYNLNLQESTTEQHTTNGIQQPLKSTENDQSVLVHLNMLCKQGFDGTDTNVNSTKLKSNSSSELGDESGKEKYLEADQGTSDKADTQFIEDWLKTQELNRTSSSDDTKNAQSLGKPSKECDTTIHHKNKNLKGKLNKGNMKMQGTDNKCDYTNTQEQSYKSKPSSKAGAVKETKCGETRNHLTLKEKFEKIKINFKSEGHPKKEKCGESQRVNLVSGNDSSKELLPNEKLESNSDKSHGERPSNAENEFGPPKGKTENNHVEQEKSDGNEKNCKEAISNAHIGNTDDPTTEITTAIQVQIAIKEDPSESSEKNSKCEMNDETCKLSDSITELANNDSNNIPDNTQDITINCEAKTNSKSNDASSNNSDNGGKSKPTQVDLEESNLNDKIKKAIPVEGLEAKRGGINKLVKRKQIKDLENSLLPIEDAKKLNFDGYNSFKANKITGRKTHVGRYVRLNNKLNYNLQGHFQKPTFYTKEIKTGRDVPSANLLIPIPINKLDNFNSNLDNSNFNSGDPKMGTDVISAEDILGEPTTTAETGCQNIETKPPLLCGIGLNEPETTKAPSYELTDNQVKDKNVDLYGMTYDNKFGVQSHLLEDALLKRVMSELESVKKMMKANEAAKNKTSTAKKGKNKSTTNLASKNNTANVKASTSVANFVDDNNAMDHLTEGTSRTEQLSDYNSDLLQTERLTSMSFDLDDDENKASKSKPYAAGLEIEAKKGYNTKSDNVDFKGTGTTLSANKLSATERSESTESRSMMRNENTVTQSGKGSAKNSKFKTEQMKNFHDITGSDETESQRKIIGKIKNLAMHLKESNNDKKGNEQSKILTTQRSIATDITNSISTKEIKHNTHNNDEITPYISKKDEVNTSTTKEAKHLQGKDKAHSKNNSSQKESSTEGSNYIKSEFRSSTNIDSKGKFIHEKVGMMKDKNEAKVHQSTSKIHGGKVKQKIISMVQSGDEANFHESATGKAEKSDESSIVHLKENEHKSEGSSHSTKTEHHPKPTISAKTLLSTHSTHHKKVTDSGNEARLQNSKNPCDSTPRPVDNLKEDDVDDSFHLEEELDETGNSDAAENENEAVSEAAALMEEGSDATIKMPAEPYQKTTVVEDENGNPVNASSSVENGYEGKDRLRRIKPVPNAVILEDEDERYANQLNNTEKVRVLNREEEDEDENIRVEARALSQEEISDDDDEEDEDDDGKDDILIEYDEVKVSTSTTTEIQREPAVQVVSEGLLGDFQESSSIRANVKALMLACCISCNLVYYYNI